MLLILAAFMWSTVCVVDACSDKYKRRTQRHQAEAEVEAEVEAEGEAEGEATQEAAAKREVEGEAIKRAKEHPQMLSSRWKTRAAAKSQG